MLGYEGDSCDDIDGAGTTAVADDGSGVGVGVIGESDVIDASGVSDDASVVGWLEVAAEGTDVVGDGSDCSCSCSWARKITNGLFLTTVFTCIGLASGWSDDLSCVHPTNGNFVSRM